MATDRVTLSAREVVSVPLSADFTLPETSGSPCVSVLMLTAVGDDAESRNMGPGPGVLKGVFMIVSSCLKKEGRTKEVGVAKEMGLGVGPDGGIGNSLTRLSNRTSSRLPDVEDVVRTSGRTQHPHGKIAFIWGLQ